MNPNLNNNDMRVAQRIYAAFPEHVRGLQTYCWEFVTDYYRTAAYPAVLHPWVVEFVGVADAIVTEPGLDL